MGAPRTIASRLLRAVVRLAPLESRDWANAMLRELDFIEGDWAAFFWALGSTAAIFRQVGRGWRTWFAGNKRKEEEAMNGTGKKVVGFVSGMLAALALALSAFGLLRLVDLLFPSIGLAHIEWTHWLTVIVIPEIIFIAATIKLWRKRGPVAAGILVFAIVAGVHVAVHYATR